MTTKKAGERKRTVTVVVGPETMVRIAAVEEAWRERMGAPSGGLVTLVGIGLDNELLRRAKVLGLPLWSVAASHYD